MLLSMYVLPEMQRKYTHSIGKGKRADLSNPSTPNFLRNGTQKKMTACSRKCLLHAQEFPFGGNAKLAAMSGKQLLLIGLPAQAVQNAAAGENKAKQCL